jgi:hypothetical protein
LKRKRRSRMTAEELKLKEFELAQTIFREQVRDWELAEEDEGTNEHFKELAEKAVRGAKAFVQAWKATNVPTPVPVPAAAVPK